MSLRLLLSAVVVMITVVPRTSAQDNFFEKEVLPILKAHCFKCHGDEKTRGKLDLTTRADILKGGEHGPAVSLDKPETSLLLKAINYQGNLEMPPKGKLSDKEIQTLSRWVKDGVVWPPTVSSGIKKTRPEGGKVTPEARQYWAYQPVKRPETPAVKNKDWAKSPVDAFILAKLEAKGLTPAILAERTALIRRATYDLTGLPPTPEEIDVFVKDTRSDAYERLLDRLLASPHYGEKWGRHWLDLVRYAETNGYERDGPKPHAWRFRDYVIKSFNDDKPFTQFIREHLAGDELPRWSADGIVATGYYRLGLWDDEPVDPKQARYDELDDIVATTAQVFLGMTMNCARCHDHKIDPIPQADYYRLLAFFVDIPHYSDTRNTSSRFNLTDISPPEVRAKYEPELLDREKKGDEIKEAMRKIEDEVIKKMPAEDQRAAEGLDRPRVISDKFKQYSNADQQRAYTELKAKLTILEKLPIPGRDLALSVNRCIVNPAQEHVLLRGNPHNRGDKVEPGFPEVLGVRDPKLPVPAKDAKTSGRRTILAEWIGNEANPLTARVFVNRLWQQHFGRGIVASANDFGKFGDLPTHPELLDWLADEFMKGDWKIKRMHRLLMTTNTYQMASKAEAKALREDPSNALWWRYPMRRLTAEEVRDSILAVSGELTRKGGGPSVYPPLAKEVLSGQSRPGEGWGQSTREEASRRSVYVYIKRSLQVPILATHDQADTDSSCPVRYTTTVPTQALGLLNSTFSNEQAGYMADRLRKEVPNDLSVQVRRAVRLTTGREPSKQELERDLAFIKEVQSSGKLDERAALKQYCLLLLNTNEFLYLD